MNLRDKTTDELTKLKEKLISELDERKNEKLIPVAKMIGLEENEYFDINTIDEKSELIIDELKSSIEEKKSIFNITIKMMPESDYLLLKEYDLI